MCLFKVVWVEDVCPHESGRRESVPTAVTQQKAYEHRLGSEPSVQDWALLLTSSVTLAAYLYKLVS